MVGIRYEEERPYKSAEETTCQKAMTRDGSSRLCRFCICTASIFASAACATHPIPAELVLTKQETALSTSSPSHLEKIIRARDEEYERERRELFRDPRTASEVLTQGAGGEPVAAFVARTLKLWLLQETGTFDSLEAFIVTDEPKLRTDSRSALPGGGSTALLKHIDKYENRQQVLDYLLLRTLMRPKSQTWVYGALLRYFNTVAVHEPEVWIRIAIQNNDKDIFENVANHSLKIADKRRVLRALNLERNRLRDKGQVFPEALETLRNSLSSQP
jgi:hypothetical protein